MNEGESGVVRQMHPLLPRPDEDEDQFRPSSPSSFIISPAGTLLTSSTSEGDGEEDDDSSSTRTGEDEETQETSSASIGWVLLGGETILLKVSAYRVSLSFGSDQFESDLGTFFVTNFRLVFVSSGTGNRLEFPITTVSSVEKIGGKRRSPELTSYRLDIQSKYMRPILRLAFARTGGVESQKLRSKVYKLLLACGPNQPSKFMFAFSYHGNEAGYKGDLGWGLADPLPYFARLGVSPNEQGAWRITHMNSDYQLCDTRKYPRILAVPANITDAELKVAATHRRRGRIPALSWIHPVNKASITRCAQPLSGVSILLYLLPHILFETYQVARSHSPEDVKLVTSILASAPGASELLIMDARPLANARANAVMGAGYEHVARYANCKLDFMGIPNIHVVRDSWNRLKELLTDETKKQDDNRWRSALESTSWHQYIGMVLSASCKLVDSLESGVSVLTHCSDGWDRTAQLVSLAMLMLDPEYRTIKGFSTLIERQWVDYGHKFAQRHGHSVTRTTQPPSTLLASTSNATPNTSTLETEQHTTTSEWSPIFVQFLDCVWQLTRQFPTSFEFNDSFLNFIADHSYSCRFGTFLANSRREQQTMCLHEATVSIWTHIAMLQDEFTNPLYHPSGLLRANFMQQNLHVWPYFTLHVPSLPPHPSVVATTRAVDLARKAKAATERAQTLETELAACTKRLMELLTTSPEDISSLNTTSTTSTSPTPSTRKKLFSDDIG